MTKEEAIKCLTSLLEVRRKYCDMKTSSDEIEALDMAIESLEGNTAFLKVTFDRDEMQRCVDKAKEEIKTGIIAGFNEDLQEIYYELWKVDIPSPTVPEYREHHEQIQGIMAVVSEKIKKWQEDDRK